MAQALFRRHGSQVAALCWRAAPELQILLITSRNTRRWILPKGWREEGQTPMQCAAREAFEEAGVSGAISPTPLGEYYYLKGRKDGGGLPCRVDVYALETTHLAPDFPEKGQRIQAWMSPAEAAARLSEPALRDIARAFARDWTKPRRRTG